MSYSQEDNLKYLRDRYANQRGMFFEFLGGAKCNLCGSLDNLEIDHINRITKSFPIGKLWPVNKLPEVFKELKKCQVLCNKCHIIKTVSETKGIERGFIHGTLYSWMKKKCNCETCSEAKRLWHDKRNKQRRKGDGYGPKNQIAECGTYKSYKRGCKCKLCRAANAAHAREQRLSKVDTML